ncbi:hypothetical protein BV898_14564 [Hypsibius exemplaris]|uniref:Uncharacterized protein n=1 Tax=Hypsibius exemplaris TaxID=2072580 RepID=A0A9X6NCD2_HYPEX|nr:hypothetical protein BV898_14564 [Hypsibius exemplaris]
MVKDGENKFDYFLRIGVRRPSMVRNRAITASHMEVGAQLPPFGQLKPKDHAYGVYKPRGKWDYVANVMHNWKEFNQDDQLRNYTKENRKCDAMKTNIAALDVGVKTNIAALDAGMKANIAALDAGMKANIAVLDAGMKANIAALDAGMKTPKEWNQFCLTHKQSESDHFAAEHTQQSFLENRRSRIPNLVERERVIPDLMARVLMNDYGRDWFLRQWAQRTHETTKRQIDARMLGAKFNTSMEVHHAHGQSLVVRRNDARERLRKGFHLALPEMGTPKNLRDIKAHISTFRDGDNHHMGWRPQRPNMDEWQNVLQSKPATENSHGGHNRRSNQRTNGPTVRWRPQPTVQPTDQRTNGPMAATTDGPTNGPTDQRTNGPTVRWRPQPTV